MKKIQEVLTQMNPGDHWEVDNVTKIEILKQVLPEYNLKIGQTINRHNEAGDSFNKVIGFMLTWHHNNGHYFVDDTNLHIICDRVKVYNKNYSPFYNEPEFFHGEIWAYSELRDWRQKGYILENTLEAEVEYIEARKKVTKSHECCFVDDMLTW